MKQLFIARCRVEPETAEGLKNLFDFLLAAKPDGLRVLPPEEHHTCAYVYFEPFLAKNASRANGSAEWALRRKLIKHSGVDVKRLTVEVLRVKQGDKWPEDWYSAESADRLGSLSNDQIELRKR